MNEKKNEFILIINNKIGMFSLFGVTFKDSATPFAEALVELHHEIMFYLIVIVSVVIYILLNAISISRVRESYFFSNFFSLAAFFKSIILNSVIGVLFGRFLDTSFYSNFYSRWELGLNRVINLILITGNYFLPYFLILVIYTKSFLLSLSQVLHKIESFFVKFFRDYKAVNETSYVPNAHNSSTFFYKTRITSSYRLYVSNIVTYLSLFSLLKDIEYEAVHKNLKSLSTYFQLFSSSDLKLNSRNAVVLLEATTIDQIYYYPIFRSLDVSPSSRSSSQFVIFFLNYLRNRFTSLNSIRLSIDSKLCLSPNRPKDSDLIYSFLNAQAYTIHNTKLEIIWTIIPTVILILIAIPSFILLYSLDEVINPSITLKAIGHQWYWSYEYSDYTDNDSINFDSYMITENDLELGRFRLLEVDNRVVLPVNTHVRVLVTAGDVLHSWAVPAMNIKADAVPGRLNQLTLFIKRPGVYYGQCSELCGVNHAFMPIVIEAVSLWNYSNWLTSRFAESGVDFELIT